MGLQVGKLQSASLLFAFPGARHRGAPVKEFTISLLFAPPRGASLVAQTVKNPSAMQETQVQFPGRSPGEGNDYPLQYPCLENSMDRGSWWARVHEGHKKSDTIEQLTVSRTGMT